MLEAKLRMGAVPEDALRLAVVVAGFTRLSNDASAGVSAARGAVGGTTASGGGIEAITWGGLPGKQQSS